MTKIQHTILVALLTCAGLLIAVLYSPFGSPDFYTSSKNRTESLKVAPINGTIANAPKRYAVSENAQDETDLPELTPPSISNRGIGNTVSKMNSSTGSINRVAQFPTYHHTNTVSTGIHESPFLAGGGKRNSAGSSAILMTNGITTLSVTSEVNNTVSKQNATDQITTTDGLSDPGEIGPTGDPIPIGDGWELLVLLGVCYGFFKRNSK